GPRSGGASAGAGGRALRRRRLHPARGAQAPRTGRCKTHPRRPPAARRHLRRWQLGELRRASNLRGRDRPPPTMRGTRLLLALAASASLAMPEAAAQAPQGSAPGSVPQVSPTEDLRSAKPGAEPAARFIPLEVSINGARAGNWVLMERAGVLYAPADAFDEWRLNRDPRAPAVMQ